ncbi:MAG: septum site-determining protein [Geodermatophilaceae bacterium]|nr:septum site-determining protein [Geodermatophilaceae bacterium]
MERVLVLTADEVLLDDILRLVAAAGCEADVSRDVGQIRARWRMAPLVLVGGDLLAAAAKAGLPRRDGTLLLCRHPLQQADWSLAVDVGVAHVLTLPAAESAVIGALADAAETAAAPGWLVGVVAGRGGAGASVVTAALAVTAARLGRSALAVDADPLGGGLDLLFGAEEVFGLRWPELTEVSGRLSAVALHQALPSAYGVSILAHQRGRVCDPGAEAMLAVARTGRRAGDVVVADLPRQMGPGSSALGAAADLVLLVVPAEVRACAAAARVADGLSLVTESARIVVRTVRGGTLGPDVVADNLGLPLAGVLRTESGLTAALERGEAPAGRGRGPVAALARAVLRDLDRPVRRRAA